MGKKTVSKSNVKVMMEMYRSGKKTNQEICERYDISLSYFLDLMSAYHAGVDFQASRSQPKDET